jgi:hypothetical protein
MSDLATELQAIRTKHRKLSPKLVLQEARKPGHPLHDRFEWDDGVAGEAYRLIQARELIMKVKMRFTDSTGETRTVRRFYAIRASDADQYDYEDVEEALRDSFRRKLLMNEMRRRLDELEQQYGALQEFWAAIQKMARKKKAS